MLTRVVDLFWKRSSVVMVTALLALVISNSLINGLSMIGTPFAGFWVHKSLLTSDIMLSNWTGYHSDIQIYNRILAINHHPLKDIQQFKQTIAQLPPGSPVTYTLRRPDGRRVNTTVKTMRYSKWDFVRYNLTFLFAPVLLLLLVLFVIFSTRDYSQVKPALGFCLINGFVSALFEDVECFHQLGIFSMAFQNLFPAALLHLGLSLNRRYLSDKVYRWVATGIWGTVLVYSCLVMAAYYQFQSDWRVMSSITWFDTLYRFNGFLYLSAFGCFPLLVLYAYLKSPLDSLEKRQTRVILTGSIIGCAPLFFLLFIPMMFLDGKPWLSTEILILGLSIFPFFIVYAMLRYKAFDIEIYIRKVLQYYALTILFVGFLVLCQLVIAALLAPWIPVHDDWKTLFATVIAFVLPYQLRNLIQNWIDRIFYRQRLNVQEQLNRFEEASLSQLEVSALIGLYLDTVETTLHPSMIAFEAHEQPRAGDAHVEKTSVFTLQRGEGVPEIVLELTDRDQSWGLLRLGPRKSELSYGPVEQDFLNKLGNILIRRWRTAQLATSVREMRIQQEQLNQRHTFLRELTTNLSHDLKSPLGNNYDVVQGLQKQWEAGTLEPNNLVNGLSKLSMTADKLSQYILMSLDRESISQGKLILNQEQVDMQEVCQESILLHQDQIDRAGLELAVDCPDAAMFVLGDRMRLEHVVSNLLANALRHAQHKVSLRLSREGNHLLLRVEDDGTGISPDKQAQLFDRYSYDIAQNRQEGRRVGTGLGLWICKSYVEKMQGEIRYEYGESGTRSRFVIKLPLMDKSAHVGVPIEIQGNM